MTPEEWRPIPGYEGRYEVSDHGRVRSLGFYMNNARGTKTWKPGRVRKPGRHRQGYRMVSLFDGRGGRWTVKIPKLVLLAFVGPPPPGKADVLHEDDVPTHDHLNNLRWGDQSENSHDAIRNGVHPWVVQERCKRGHLLAEPNLIVSMKGRTCRSCNLTANNRTQDELAAARGITRRSYRRGRDGFLRRAGETFEQEADRRYAHIMRDHVGGL